MLAAQICRELRLGAIAARMQSRVPRCLFGPPNPRDTMDLLQEALETERTRFARRWGVDPLAEDEDKENGSRAAAAPRLSPTKKRPSPYAKQTSIHDYWRSRKICDPGKKSASSTLAEAAKQQQQPQQTQPQNLGDKKHSPTN